MRQQICQLGPVRRVRPQHAVQQVPRCRAQLQQKRIVFSHSDHARLIKSCSMTAADVRLIRSCLVTLDHVGLIGSCPAARIMSGWSRMQQQPMLAAREVRTASLLRVG